MPIYNYIGFTKQGEWLKGDSEAASKEALESELTEHGIMLVTWAEAGAPIPGSAPGPAHQETITAEEGRARWVAAAKDRRLIPQVAALVAILSAPKFGQLQWIRDHSFGAAQTAFEALLVLALAAGFLASAVHITLHGIHFAADASPLELPSVTQPEMSAKKVNGQRRRVNTYRLEKARAGALKLALDHVMRGTSMTSELATTMDSALVVKATPLDLLLVDALIPVADKDYTEMTDSQAEIRMIESMLSARDRWMKKPPPEPKPTPGEQKEDEEEQAAASGSRP